MLFNLRLWKSFYFIIHFSSKMWYGVCIKLSLMLSLFQNKFIFKMAYFCNFYFSSSVCMTFSAMKYMCVSSIKSLGNKWIKDNYSNSKSNWKQVHWWIILTIHGHDWMVKVIHSLRTGLYIEMNGFKWLVQDCGFEP